VDLPSSAGTCEPLDSVADSVKDVITNAEANFLGGCIVPAPRGLRCKAEQKEYVELVFRELKCGKLELRLAVKAAADVFGVGNPGKPTMRKIWSGNHISAQAVQPPAPPLIANPCCFLDVVVPSSGQVLYSKRDSATCFDVLKCLEALHPFFGQPPVSLQDLLAQSGWSLEYLSGFTQDLGDDPLCATCMLHPINVVLSMGFAWFSMIEQSCTISRLTAAGVSRGSILSMDEAPPKYQHELCLVATDDIVLLHCRRARVASMLAKINSSLEQAGMPRNKSKDVDAAFKVTTLGCDLSNSPPTVDPNADKMLQLASGLVDLLFTQWASARGIYTVLGVKQWFALLQRSLLSVFDFIFDVVRKEP